MRAIDHYVRDLAERLPAAGGLRERVREEVTGHLSDAASDLEQQGMPPAEAEQRAIAGFGSPDAVARGILEDLGLLARSVAAILARSVALLLGVHPARVPA
ncbi:MAG TPA: permease prefix domain 1-containing protein [Candidatus Dormibacteraeota bacterium]|nr:permease prefix domain 1-containing protein [Candidatus Dormibacteraeota bacterium]